MLGRFNRKFFIDFLRDIDEAELSGILRLRHNKTLKVLFFESGHLVFAISNLPDEELGQYLVNIGRIPAEHLKQIKQYVSREHPLTFLLLHYKLLTHEELVKFEQDVISMISLSCFDLQGEYTFDGSKTADHEYKVQIRALDVLISGIRSIDDEDYIRRSIGDLSQVIRPVSDLMARTRRVNLSQLEAFVLTLVDRTKSVQTLINESGMPELDALKSLYALLATGILDPLEEPEPVEEPPQFIAPEASFIFEAGESLLSPSAPQSFAATPVFEAPSASNPRVSGAFKRLSPLDQAYTHLEAAQREAPQPVVQTPRVEPPKKKRIDTAKLEAIAGVKIRSSSQRDFGTPKQVSEEEMRAEQWFVQGKQCLRIGDIRRAETLFRQATELMPDKPKYLLALAMLIVKRPSERKEAEGLLLKCCELEPNAIEPRMQLAVMYENSGQHEQAEQLYRSVLSIQPNHPVASSKVKKESIWNQDVGSLFNKFLKK